VVVEVEGSVTMFIDHGFLLLLEFIVFGHL
jgi:hypothetical protein